jgi:hypothetical protein
MNQYDEYTSPNTAKCRAKSLEIKCEIAEFLAKGGSINQLKSDIESTEQKKTTQKREIARKRGLKNMIGETA